MNIGRLSMLLLVATLSASCGESAPTNESGENMAKPVANDLTVSDSELAGNPFRKSWDTPFGVPPFAEISTDDYLPAVKKALQELRTDVDAIVSNTDAPTFDNTILALEITGDSLNQVASTFSNITGTDTNDELRALQTQIYPMLTRETDAIALNAVLYCLLYTSPSPRDKRQSPIPS